MDETYFLFSEKGKRNIADRKPRKGGGKAKCRGIGIDQACDGQFRLMIKNNMQEIIA